MCYIVLHLYLQYIFYICIFLHMYNMFFIYNICMYNIYIYICLKYICYIFVFLCTISFDKYIFTYTIFRFIYIYNIYLYLFLNLYIYIFLYLYLYLFIYVYVYIYIFMYIPNIFILYTSFAAPSYLDIVGYMRYILWCLSVTYPYKVLPQWPYISAFVIYTNFARLNRNPTNPSMFHGKITIFLWFSYGFRMASLTSTGSPSPPSPFEVTAVAPCTKEDFDRRRRQWNWSTAGGRSNGGGKKGWYRM